MSEFVLEIGCEELPASQVSRAAGRLASGLVDRLAEAGLAGSVRSLATPRRLIVIGEGFPAVAGDEVRRQRGPSLSAAYDSDGRPTKALEGFCRGQGIEPGAVEADGEYVWTTKVIPGRSLSEILAEAAPAALGAVPFDKTMRWGTGSLRFARPIRWILALCDGEVVPFSFGTVASGSVSRGHRFLAPEEFSVSSASELLEGLLKRFVQPDSAVREELIRKETERIAEGLAQLEDALVDENVQLTEWPMPTLGEFREDFLALPEPVLITAMAKHEKMFPVRGADGRLVNRFVFVRNGGDEATVARGAAWVLNARFNDAKFFFDEDARWSLNDFLSKTEAMSFQEGLGTVRMRADRLAGLAEAMAPAGSEAALRTAGLYAKADLASGLVGELASLQGVVGAEYGLRDGLDPVACRAIRGHYGLDPESAEARILMAADQLDKLVGFLGLGMAPTGSSDPYALRRAAGLLLEAGLLPGAPTGGWARFVPTALAVYAEQGIALDGEAVETGLAALARQRWTALLAEHDHDVREATLESGDLLNAPEVSRRARETAAIKFDSGLVGALLRPVNLAASARQKGLTIPTTGDSTLLTTPAEAGLKDALAGLAGPLGS
ncbi:MAG: glycine--tRNA ligase subunit beta, partial [Fimbriimonadaceae bacterium]|nr:glycine--tRNA ligase subunit beta [Fimbriimonadaceae bacterium]